jgi:hypothetical protein
VTERVEEDGTSRVVGVFTSIPDLIRKGIERQSARNLRLSLVKLDSDKDLLGSWTNEEFNQIESDLEPFVRTEEFSIEHCKALAQALTAPARV